MAGALGGVTVLDLTQHVAGPYATKLLADFGADVIKVEPPRGDSARRLGPFKGGKPHPDGSGTFFFFNTNKRSVVLDLETAAGTAAFLRLAERADVVVESMPPGELDALGVGWATLHVRVPQLPLVSITNFGQNGPYHDYKGSDLVLWAFAGEMFSCGRLDLEPTKMYGTAALVESGSAAATAIMGALFARRLHGVGQHVDFSLADSQFVGVDRRHATIIGEQFSGRKSLRSPGAAVSLMVGMYPCKDGWLEIMPGSRGMNGARDFLGYPNWLSDPKWDERATARDPQAIEEFNAHLLPWLLERTKDEIWTEARRARVICGPLFRVDEVYHDGHFRGRGLWQHAVTEQMGSFDFPGRPFLLSETPWEYRGPAPRLGEHTVDVLREAGFSDAEFVELTGQSTVEVAR